jgi:hypothetical protein
MQKRVGGVRWTWLLVSIAYALHGVFRGGSILQMGRGRNRRPDLVYWRLGGGFVCLGRFLLQT